jgi:CheY-like chemotaxis protein
MSKTILLADDSVTIQKVVELSLMDDGHKVVAFNNGDDALARLATVQPDLVVADIHMPGANGYEVARRVKASGARVPVLLLVGTFEPFDQAKYDSCGADAFMRKPFDSQELSSQVAKLLQGSGAGEPAEVPVESAAPRISAAALDVVVDGENEVTSSWAALPSLAPEPPAPTPASSAPAGNWEDFAVAEFESPEAGMKTQAVMATGPGARASETTLRLKPIGSAASGPAPAAGGTPASVPPAAPVALSEADIDRICRRVLEVLSEKVVREITWEVVPDLAEVEIKNRIREIESQAE